MQTWQNIFIEITFTRAIISDATTERAPRKSIETTASGQLHSATTLLVSATALFAPSTTLLAPVTTLFTPATTLFAPATALLMETPPAIIFAIKSKHDKSNSWLATGVSAHATIISNHASRFIAPCSILRVVARTARAIETTKKAIGRPRAAVCQLPIYNKVSSVVAVSEAQRGSTCPSCRRARSGRSAWDARADC